MEQVEYLLHRDLGAKFIEVDPWYGPHSFRGETARWKKDRSVPFIYGEQGTAFLRSVDALPTSRRAADPASSLERLQCLSQALVLNRKQVAELRSREHCVLDKKIKQPDLETASVVFVQLGDDLQMGRRVGRDKLQIDWWRSRRRAVFVGQYQAFLGASEVEVRVAKGIQVAGTSESLTGGDSPRGVFPRVMHQHDREVEPPLKGAKVGQQPGHFGRVVLVDSMKSYQGIEKQEPGPDPLGRLEEPRAVITWISTPARSRRRCRAIPSMRSRTTGIASSAK